MTVGERIKDARRRAGLTQEQLAAAVNVAAITIRQYESGKRQPTLDRLAVIAKALDTNVGALVSGGWSSLALGEYLFCDPEEETLLKHFRNLNYDGRVIAIERMKELTEIPRYTENAQTDSEE